MYVYILISSYVSIAYTLRISIGVGVCVCAGVCVCVYVCLESRGTSLRHYCSTWKVMLVRENFWMPPWSINCSLATLERGPEDRMDLKDSTVTMDG